jgi:DNA polymerase kappa
MAGSEPGHEEIVKSRLALNPFKAGLNDSSVERNRVEAIVYEASKGSKFFIRENERAKQTEQKVKQLLATRERLLQDPTLVKKAESEANARAGELEASRDLGSTIVHIDMDGECASFTLLKAQASEPDAEIITCSQRFTQRWSAVTTHR